MSLPHVWYEFPCCMCLPDSTRVSYRLELIFTFFQMSFPHSTRVSHIQGRVKYEEFYKGTKGQNYLPVILNIFYVGFSFKYEYSWRRILTLIRIKVPRAVQEILFFQHQPVHVKSWHISSLAQKFLRAYLENNLHEWVAFGYSYSKEMKVFGDVFIIVKL